MKAYKDDFGKLIKEEFEKIAEQEQKEVLGENDLAMPEGLKDSMLDKLHAQIREMEEAKHSKESIKESTEEIPKETPEVISEKIPEEMPKKKPEEIPEETPDVYGGLSEEDRKALELGRKILNDENIQSQETETEPSSLIRFRKKKRLKAAIILVAVLLLLLAIDMISLGVPEKIKKLVKSKVVEREVEQIESSEDNWVIKDDEEEIAYQRISEAFGVDAVKIVIKPQNTCFDNMELDTNLQVAELYYHCENKTLVYLISASYLDSSWGVDVEDEVVNRYTITNSRFKIKVKEYKVKETEEQRFSARFSYNGLDYFLIGTMGKEDFEKIINNLYFGKK